MYRYLKSWVIDSTDIKKEKKEKKRQKKMDKTNRSNEIIFTSYNVK